MSPRGQGENTPPRQVRVEDELWQPAEQAAKRAGTTRAAVIRQFLAWYLRQPGARLPERPERVSPIE